MILGDQLVKLLRISTLYVQGCIQNVGDLFWAGKQMCKTDSVQTCSFREIWVSS